MSKKAELIREIRRLLNPEKEPHCVEHKGKFYRASEFDFRTFQPIGKGVELKGSDQIYQIGETAIHF